jgi:hypothetical protein
MGGKPRHILWPMLHYSLGHSLGVLGERVGPPTRFRESADAFRASLETRDPTREAPVWALTQFNLATSLRLYAEHSGDAGAMTEAIAAYREALATPLPEAHAAIKAQAEAGLNEVLSPRPSPPPA